LVDPRLLASLFSLWLGTDLARVTRVSLHKLLLSPLLQFVLLLALSRRLGKRQASDLEVFAGLLLGDLLWDLGSVASIVSRGAHVLILYVEVADD